MDTIGIKDNLCNQKIMSTKDDISTHSRSPPRSRSNSPSQSSSSSLLSNSPRSRRKRRFKKSKTPPSRKNSRFSHSSDEGIASSDEDDFPQYRENWHEKSPVSPGSTGRFYDDLKQLDDILSEARSLIRNMLQ
jgi:hypothetical protein